MSIRPTPSFHTPRTYYEAAELLWSLHDSFSIESIGTSATGKCLYALSVGESSAPAVVYAGADLFSAVELLHFALSLPTLLAKPPTLHRIHLPTLFSHRRLCICPFLCPDVLEGPTTLTNGFGVFLPDCFDPAQQVLPEKAPEAVALRQYLAYMEPELFCVFQHANTAGLYPTTTHMPIDHLLARLLSVSVHSEMADAAKPAFLSVPRWYAADTEHLAYGITLTHNVDLQAFLLTAPLLIGTTSGMRCR